MITLTNQRHAGLILRHLRTRQQLTTRALAARLFVRHTTVSNREIGARDITLQALIDMAYCLGFDVALIPARHAGARPTGTGWPT